VTVIGLTEQSRVVYAQGRPSVFLKTADSSPEMVTVKHSPSSKPETGQQQTDGGSRDVSVKTNVHASSSFVKVQSPASERTCPVTVTSQTSSPAALQHSKQGTDDD